MPLGERSEPIRWAPFTPCAGSRTPLQGPLQEARATLGVPFTPDVGKGSLPRAGDPPLQT